MTQDEIIVMAQECRLIGMRPHLDGIYSEALVAFAKLVTEKALAEHAMREVQRLGQEIEQDADSFCDANCVWTDHHPDCKVAQPEQEPVADDIASILACRNMLDAQPVPPRTWVGLTDEDMYVVSEEESCSFVAGARWSEDILKEKNT